MIVIINYGLGNIGAFTNVYERLNIPISVANTAEDLKSATKIILPGVGAFDHAMKKLSRSGMREPVTDLALGRQVPVLGICVGMQMLARSSDEGVLPGLGWIDATVKKFDVSDLNSKTGLPHMGWNTIHPESDNPLMTNIGDDSRFYFLHTYYFRCNDPKDMIATTEYGIRYASVVNKENIFGVQFHPEKSHQWGIQLLKNFADL